MYANILMSTDGSDVARTGLKHGMALAKALNAKVTVITVTESLPVDFGGGHAGGWISSPEEVDHFDAACKERAGIVLEEARAMAKQIENISRTLAYSECAPGDCDCRHSKVQGLRLNRHGLARAARPQEAIFRESNIGGSGGRKRAGVGGPRLTRRAGSHQHGAAARAAWED